MLGHLDFELGLTQFVLHADEGDIFSQSQRQFPAQRFYPDASVDEDSLGKTASALALLSRDPDTKSLARELKRSRDEYFRQRHQLMDRETKFMHDKLAVEKQQAVMTREQQSHEFYLDNERKIREMQDYISTSTCDRRVST